MLMKTLGSKLRKTKKVQHAPEMYMKTKGAMTICPVNYMPFTRKFAHGATIDKNRSDFFAEMHRSCDKSRRSGTGIPPVRGNVARASCPCPGMAKMAMPRKAGAGGTPTQQITLACHYVLDINWVNHERRQS
jgi:hypothetical protein